MPKMFGIKSKMQILSIALENCKKSALRHFTENSILVNSKNLSAIFFPGLILKQWI